jgi:hypothetical protein
MDQFHIASHSIHTDMDQFHIAHQVNNMPIWINDQNNKIWISFTTMGKAAMFHSEVQIGSVSHAKASALTIK